MLRAGHTVHVTISTAGAAVLKQEIGLEVDLDSFRPGMLLAAPLQPLDDRVFGGRLLYHHYQDYMAPIASGSFLTAGMVICPCSGSTTSGIAHGASNNL